MEIQITPTELDLLTEILQERHAAILREISHTDHREFRQMLKDREHCLEKVMEKLGIVVPA